MPTVLRIWCGTHATLSSDEGSHASSAELISPRDQHRHADDGGQTEHDPHRSRLAFLSRSRAFVISLLAVKCRDCNDLRPVASGQRRLLDDASMAN